MTLSPNVERILSQRYYKPGEDWVRLVERVVANVCSDETKEYQDQMYFYIKNRIFLPNSPCLVNAGTKSNGLFACFVMGPTEDTLESGFNTLKDIASIAKAGGGCGFTGSVMRPKNSPVAGSAHGYSYGPNRYAELVSYAMDMMTQSGFRKMALMYTLDINHPDIEEFISIKQTANESALYNFNQSAFVDDAFIRRAINSPQSKEYKLLEKIALHAWSNGEPGILFADTINTNTPYKYTGQKILATNPCGQ